MSKLLITIFITMGIVSCYATPIQEKKIHTLDKDSVSKVLYFLSIIDFNRSIHNHCVNTYPNDIKSVNNTSNKFQEFYNNLTKFSVSLPKENLSELYSLDHCKEFSDGYSRLIDSFEQRPNTEINELLSLSKSISKLREAEIAELLGFEQ